jgi:hypothetical protein
LGEGLNINQGKYPISDDSMVEDRQILVNFSFFSRTKKISEVLNSGVNLDRSCLRTCFRRSTYSGIQHLGDLWCSGEKSPEVPKSRIREALGDMVC